MYTFSYFSLLAFFLFFSINLYSCRSLELSLCPKLLLTHIEHLFFIILLKIKGLRKWPGMKQEEKMLLGSCKQSRQNLLPQRCEYILITLDFFSIIFSLSYSKCISTEPISKFSLNSFVNLSNNAAFMLKYTSWTSFC